MGCTESKDEPPPTPRPAQQRQRVVDMDAQQTVPVAGALLPAAEASPATQPTNASPKSVRDRAAVKTLDNADLAFWEDAIPTPTSQVSPGGRHRLEGTGRFSQATPVSLRDDMDYLNLTLTTPGHFSPGPASSKARSDCSMRRFGESLSSEQPNLPPCAQQRARRADYFVDMDGEQNTPLNTTLNTTQRSTGTGRTDGTDDAEAGVLLALAEERKRGSRRGRSPALASRRAVSREKEEPTGPVREDDEDKDIGAYVMKQYLGKGSWAVVHECVHKLSCMRYAVKSYDKRKHSKGAIERSGMREAAILKKLVKERHANIANFVDTLESSRWYHVVVDLGAQGDFHRILRKHGALPEARAKQYFRQLLTAVQFIHSKNIVHRDIKPMNLLLAADDRLLITDFGLGDFITGGFNADARTRLTERCGTPDYVSPEILNTHVAYDGAQADAWSCGITLYAFLTAKTPWLAKERKAKLAEIETGVFRNASNEAALAALSHDANQLLDRILCKDVTKRVDVSSCLRSAWFKKKGAMHM